MAQFVIRVGSRTAQGLRPNNEDRFVVDETQNLFLVADGMGGQDMGERASELAAEIIPRVLHERLTAHEDATSALQKAMDEANRAIISEGKSMVAKKRMGTTAVCALRIEGHVYIASLGDSRAYLVRNQKVEQLTVDHSVAQALVNNGALTPEEAKQSPLQHVLYKFLGCTQMNDGPEIRPFDPEPGDRLLLATDGLTNHVTEEDLITGPARYPNPQTWAIHLVDVALERGSRDNVTCIVVAFDEE